MQKNIIPISSYHIHIEYTLFSGIPNVIELVNNEYNINKYTNTNVEAHIGFFLFTEVEGGTGKELVYFRLITMYRVMNIMHHRTPYKMH